MSSDSTRVQKPEHGSLDWLNLRHRDADGRVRFGASEAPVLMGVSKYRTIADLALDKWAAPEVKEQNEAMIRGTMLEPALIQFAASVLGQPVNTPEEMFVEGRFIATLDGITDNEEIIVEAKTTTAYSCDDPLPAEFYWQGIAQLACHPTARFVYFVVLDKRMRLAMPQAWLIDREDHGERIEQLLHRAEIIGEALDDYRLPEGTVVTESHIKAMYPEPLGTKELGHTAIALLDAYRCAKSAREQAEQQEKQVRNELVAMLAEAEIGTVDGQQVVSYKSRNLGERVDMKRLEQEHPELVAQYRKPAGRTRVLKVIGE